MSDDRHEYTVTAYLERCVTTTVTADDWQAAEEQARKAFRYRLSDEGIRVEAFNLSIEELVRTDREAEQE